MSQDNEAIGRSRGGYSTKIHLAVDARGQPIKFLLTAGQVHDITQAEHLFEGTGAECVVGDRGYDSNAFVSVVTDRGAKVVIPSRSNIKTPRPLNKTIYKERNRVERCINRLKQWRRVATRYEKTARNFSSFVACAAAMILLK